MKEILTDISNQHDLLVKMQQHHKSVFTNITNFYTLIVDDIQAYNNSYRNSFTKFFNSILDSQNDFNFTMHSTSQSGELNKSSYESFAISKNTEVLANLEKQYTKIYISIQKFKNTMFSPLDDFNENIFKTFSECIDSCKGLILEVTELQRNYEKAKDKYSDTLKELEASHKELSSLDFDSDEFKKMQEKNIKLIAYSQVIGEALKYEIKRVNSEIKKIEAKYNRTLDMIQKNEECRISYILMQESRFAEFLCQFGSAFTETGKELKNFNDKSSALSKRNDGDSKDSQLKQLSFSSIKKVNFKIESFEKIHKEISQELEGTSRRIRSSMTEHFNKSRRSTSINLSPLNLLNEIKKEESSTEVIYLNPQISDQEIESIMNQFWQKIKLHEEIDISLLTTTNFLILSEMNASQLLIDEIFSEKKVILQVKLLSYENLIHLSNVLNSVVNTSTSSYNIMFAILFLAERIFFKSNDGKKVYLCQILSKNKIYSSKPLWIKLYNNKLFSKIAKAFDNQKSTLSKLTYSDNLRISGGYSYDQVEMRERKPSQISNDKGGFLSLLKNMFTDKKDIESEWTNIPSNDDASLNSKRKSSIHFQQVPFEKVMRKSSRVESITLSDRIDKYLIDRLKLLNDDPNPLQLELTEKIKMEESSNVLKSFISYFCNFSLDIPEAIEIILEICSSVGIPKDKFSLYINYLNSSTYSIRMNTKDMENKLTKLKNLKKPGDTKCFVLSLSIKFLNHQDLFSLLQLNRCFSKRIIKQFYKQELLETDVKNDRLSVNSLIIYLSKRVSVWSKILKVSSLKNRISYTETMQVLDSLRKDDYINNYNKRRKTSSFNNSDYADEKFKLLNLPAVCDSFAIINLDVIRTSFSENADQKRATIENILKCFVLSTNSKSYCQGMNHIVSFLLQLTGDEDLTFYLFYGLYHNTEFGPIFNPDLKQLKRYFYIFERLLILYTPELNSYFYYNNIGSSYYCSPWFMTLFSSCYNTQENETSMILIKIWDEFLINGWLALLKTGIVLCMYYEDMILGMTYENILSFLFNDILRIGFFNNSNFSRFLEMWEKIVFPFDLVNNLENEYNQENKGDSSKRPSY